MNVQEIYPSVEGYVTEVMTKEEAIERHHELAALNGWCFGNDEEALKDLLSDPATTLTDKPVGEIVTPYED